MPLGAGSAASQGRQRRGLSAMTVYSGKGAAWGQRQRSVAPPCPPPQEGEANRVLHCHSHGSLRAGASLHSHGQEQGFQL